MNQKVTAVAAHTSEHRILSTLRRLQRNSRHRILNQKEACCCCTYKRISYPEHFTATSTSIETSYPEPKRSLLLLYVRTNTQEETCTYGQTPYTEHSTETSTTIEILYPKPRWSLMLLHVRANIVSWAFHGDFNVNRDIVSWTRKKLLLYIFRTIKKPGVAARTSEHRSLGTSRRLQRQSRHRILNQKEVCYCCMCKGTAYSKHSTATLKVIPEIVFWTRKKSCCCCTYVRTPYPGHSTVTSTSIGTSYLEHSTATSTSIETSYREPGRSLLLLHARKNAQEETCTYWQHRIMSTPQRLPIL